MLANIITFSRILLTFVVIGGFRKYTILDIALTFTIALIFLLDALDGYIARKRNETSKFGGVLDTVADRIIENTFWIYFSAIGYIPVWMPISVVTRGFLTDTLQRMPRDHLADDWWGSLTRSRISRGLYGTLKMLAFMCLASHRFLENTVWVDMSFILATLTVSVCFIRALPTFMETYKTRTKPTLQKNFARFLIARKASPGQPKYPRKLLDEILEYIRFTKVLPYLPKGIPNLLDIGAGDGRFIRFIEEHCQQCVGIDSHLPHDYVFGHCRLIRGVFPDDFQSDTQFDVITMMAVAEHIPMEVFPDVAEACWKYLKPNGYLILTVQHPRVEGPLDTLKALRIVEGFSMHEHYGFDPECLPRIFNRWKLIKREKWGFGCNNLFIFENAERR